MKINQERALKLLPALTLEQLAQRLLNDSLDGYMVNQDADDAAQIFTAYMAATNAVQASVKSQLGIA